MLRVFALKDEKTSSILSFNSFRNKFTLLKFIKFKERKIAKQSRKSIIFAKFASDKKTSKRFKQTRINVTNSFNLNVLQ